MEPAAVQVQISGVPDLRTVDASRLEKLLTPRLPDLRADEVRVWAEGLISYATDPDTDDRIVLIAPDGEAFAVGIVTDRYEHAGAGTHRLAVDWVADDLPRSCLGRDLRRALNGSGTVFWRIEAERPDERLRHVAAGGVDGFERGGPFEGFTEPARFGDLDPSMCPDEPGAVVIVAGRPGQTVQVRAVPSIQAFASRSQIEAHQIETALSEALEARGSAAVDVRTSLGQVEDPIGFRDSVIRRHGPILNQEEPEGGPYFILNHSGYESGPYENVSGRQYVFREGVAGAKRLPLANASGGSYIEYHTSNFPGPTGQTFVASGRISEVYELDVDPEDDERRRRWKAVLSGREQFRNPVPADAVEIPGWNHQHPIAQISEEVFQSILEASESTDEAIHLLVEIGTGDGVADSMTQLEVEPAEGPATSDLENISRQLDRGQGTFLFVADGDSLVAAKLLDITVGRSAGHPIRLGLETFGESPWHPNDLLTATTSEPVRLPLPEGRKLELVRLRTHRPPTTAASNNPTAGSSGDLGGIDARWLEQQTLWPAPRIAEILESLKTGPGQIVLYGPPGTSKTHVAFALARYLTGGREGASRVVQFHPSYTYEEFVEGLRPEPTSDGLSFKVTPGVLKRFIAEIEGEDPHVLIIDEMNRGNLPRILGELMLLLEYRDTTVDLQYSTGFALPRNLIIIGTMNTADRSIRSVDVALRRRFDFFECAPDRQVLERFYSRSGHTNRVSRLAEGFEALNRDLEDHIDRHHTVGHTFFMKPEFTHDDLQRAWNRQLVPLFEEFFMDQPDLLKDYQLDRYWPRP